MAKQQQQKPKTTNSEEVTPDLPTEKTSDVIPPATDYALPKTRWQWTAPMAEAYVSNWAGMAEGFTREEVYQSFLKSISDHPNIELMTSQRFHAFAATLRQIDIKLKRCSTAKRFDVAKLQKLARMTTDFDSNDEQADDDDNEI